jgi:putative FmdB family regulatory protein
MPIYEYRCGACGQRFEELVSASNEDVLPCPSCGSAETVRLYSSFATEWKPSIVNWHRVD